MINDKDCVLEILFFGLFCLILGFILGDSIREENMQKQFVQTKCAQYSPITGKFELIKKIK